MKRLFITSLFFFSMISVFDSSKPQAGVVVGLVSGNPGRGTLVGLAIGTSVGIAGASALTLTLAMHDRFYGANDLLLNMAMGGAIFAVAGGVLGIDASLSHEHLLQFFKTEYPFLNNHEALLELALAIKGKLRVFSGVNPDNQAAMITLTRSELSRILSGTEISPEQFEQIVVDLE